MSAEVFQLPPSWSKGNAARQALMQVLLQAAVTNEELSPVLATFILGELYLAGFKIVPLGGR